MNATMIRKGDKVYIKKQYQDAGDEKFTRIAVENEDGGRVLIETHVLNMAILPTEVIDVNMLCDHANCDPYFETCDDCGAHFDLNQ